MWQPYLDTNNLQILYLPNCNNLSLFPTCCEPAYFQTWTEICPTSSYIHLAKWGHGKGPVGQNILKDATDMAVLLFRKKNLIQPQCKLIIHAIAWGILFFNRGKSHKLNSSIILEKLIYVEAVLDKLLFCLEM